MIKSNTFDDLPSELLIYTLSFLQFRDVLKVRSVSKRFDELISTSVRLQYLIELGVAGYIDNALDRAFTEERLRRLLEHQEAWKRPDLHVARTISISGHGDYRTYTRGIFLRLDSDNMPGFDTLEVYDLMSPANPPWTIHTDFEFSNDCDMDPVQDLIILPHVSPAHQSSSLDISVLSLRHGTVHPRASCSPIRVGFGTWDMPLCTSVQLADDVVALSVYTHRFAHKFEVVILEWMTGTVKMRLPQPADRVLRDLLLVSPHWLLVTSITRYPGRLPAVDVYSLDRVTTVEREEGNTTIPVHVATYELPSPRPEHVARILITGNTSWEYHKSIGSRGDHGHSFGTSKLNSIIHITLKVVELPSNSLEHRRQHIFDVFTPLSTFLADASTLHEINPNQAMVFPWGEWGPRSTRWFRDLSAYHTACAHGYRVIWPDKVWDFNPLDTARDISRKKDISSANRSVPVYLHEEATIIKADDIFTEDILSSLPYRETEIENSLGFQGVWSTDRLIGWNITEEGIEVRLLEGVSLPPLCELS